MKYESLKTLILTILVLFSILLTWNLWTYQPHYETMESNNYVDEVTLGEKKDVQKVVTPDKIIFHVKGEHYGTNKSSELDKIMKSVSKWTFTDVANYTNKVGNFNNLVHGSGNAELVFADKVPIELYRSVLKIEGRKIPSFSFDRMIIKETPDKEEGVVYFASTDTEQVYISHISLVNLNQFTHDYFRNASQFPSYFAYDVSDDQTIFLPEDETKMETYKYFPVPLNSDQFKNALFSDPSFVTRSKLAQGEEYTNGTSKMTVDDMTNMLLYVNPTADDNYMDTPYSLVKRSIDFVNEHGGWTDAYRYVSKDDYQQTVTFRMYTDDGFPIFNEQGLSEITEVWGRNEINKYMRPNISLELPLTSETETVKLPSGHDILSILKNKKGFKPGLLEDLVLGYQMERDADESKVILLEPAWFYRYDNTWEQVTMDNWEE